MVYVFQSNPGLICYNIERDPSDPCVRWTVVLTQCKGDSDALCKSVGVTTCCSLLLCCRGLFDTLLRYSAALRQIGMSVCIVSSRQCETTVRGPVSLFQFILRRTWKSVHKLINWSFGSRTDASSRHQERAEKMFSQPLQKLLKCVYVGCDKWNNGVPKIHLDSPAGDYEWLHKC